MWTINEVSRYGRVFCGLRQRGASSDLTNYCVKPWIHVSSIVFLGYQGNAHQSENVDKQVYALWNVLQKRNFKYSSTTNTSLSSNVVYTQRVRTLDDALESSQINCVDGSVLLASLMKAININPILVRIPGHMFVGYYTDKSHKNMNFLETTMIGDVNLDDFFPDEKLDSTMVGKSRTRCRN